MCDQWFISFLIIRWHTQEIKFKSKLLYHYLFPMSFPNVLCNMGFQKLFVELRNEWTKNHAPDINII